MFRAHRAHHQEGKNCVNTTSGSCQWPCRVQAGSEVHFRPAHDTATDTE